MLPTTPTESPHVRESKTVLDSGFNAVHSRFQVLDSGFLELYTGFQSPGFQIFKIEFPDSGILYMGETEHSRHVTLLGSFRF